MTTSTMSARTSADHDGAVPEWTLGDRLRKALRHADIPVNHMSEVLGVSPATISRWMADRGPIRKVYLQLWADLTGVSTDWLENGEYAMRDLNPQPADLGFEGPVERGGLVLVHSVPFAQDGVKAGFTPDLRVAK